MDQTRLVHYHFVKYIITFGITHTWTNCTHVTDSCIFSETFERKFKRSPEDSEVRNMMNRLVSLLKDSFKADPRYFSEVLGARSLLLELPDMTDWKIAIATGGWHRSADFKLQCLGLSTKGIPISTADDAVSRECIVTSCITKAKLHYGVDRFSKIVSIGDGVWDIGTANNLSLPFIGVGDKTYLERFGATHTVQDFRDVDHFVHLLEVVIPLTL